MLEPDLSDATVRQVQLLDQRGRSGCSNSLQNGRQPLIVNPVAVLDGEIVAKVQTCERWVLEYKVKDLLLELASINTIVFQGERDQTFIINDPME